MRPLGVFLLLLAPWIRGEAAGLETSVSQPGPFNPAYADLPTLRAALDARRITSEELVRYYLNRIGQLDKRGPRINAMITLNPHAIEDARAIDQRTAGGKGFLYGIPFVVKDNYDSAGLPTSGGSVALKGSSPLHNAFVLQMLLDQGAILLGKTNLSELASSYGRLGYSSVGGLTLNPYNTARNASGSSSGSAAAVAADFAPFALGTDTSGSIRGPASVTGLVGLRPTLGLTSRTGVMPASLSTDTTAAMTRTVADQAIVLDAIAISDPLDTATSQRPASARGYGEALRQAGGHAGLRGVRLGAVSNFRGGNDEVDAAEREALRVLAAQGAVIVPIELPKDFENLWDLVLGPLAEAEFKPQFERYLRSLPANAPKSLAQLIERYASHDAAALVNPARLDALRKANTTDLNDSPTYIRILTDTVPRIRRELLELAGSKGPQAFVFATMSCPASPRYDRPDPTYVCGSPDPYQASYIASAAGFPEISVPMSEAHAHVPLGFSFLGFPYGEKRLLQLAQAFELAVPRLAPPALSAEREGSK